MLGAKLHNRQTVGNKAGTKLDRNSLHTRARGNYSAGGGTGLMKLGHLQATAHWQMIQKFAKFLENL